MPYSADAHWVTETLFSPSHSLFTESQRHWVFTESQPVGYSVQQVEGNALHLFANVCVCVYKSTKTWTGEHKQVSCDLQLCTMHWSADACIFFFSYHEHQNMNRETLVTSVVWPTAVHNAPICRCMHLFLLISWAPKHEQGNTSNKCRVTYSCAQCTDLQTHTSFFSHIMSTTAWTGEHKQVLCDLQLCTSLGMQHVRTLMFLKCLQTEPLNYRWQWLRTWMP